MEPVTTKIQDGVFVVTLSWSTTNPIGPDTVKALIKAMDESYKEDAKALVLTSTSSKFFSIGFDLPFLMDLNWEGFLEFYNAYNKMCLKLYTLSIPTISAITGHCIAGGCVLASMTDLRFMAQGNGKAGVNEIKLGVPVPYLSSLVLTQLLGDRRAKEMIYTGDIYDQQWLKDAGFIDRLVQPAELLDEAVEQARKLGSSPQYAFEAVKVMRTRPIQEEYLKKQEEESIKFLECWFKDDTRALLNEAKKKF